MKGDVFLTKHKYKHLIVSGTGEVSVEPDTAFISIGVLSEGKELGVIQEENATQTTKLVETLLRLGVPGNQIQTEDYRIEPLYEFRENKQFLLGYRVTHVLQVKLNDMTNIGQIIDEAVRSGANTVNSIRFTVENGDQYYLQALNLAVRDSHAKALSLTNAYGVHLYPIPLRVEEESYQVYPLSKVATFAAESTPIQPGRQKIEAKIKVEYCYYERVY
ncbi:DUF541 domain-containing protein [Bacillus sp. BGMRC 2118]|nr:DUF541 domain-containing protein [Bacillus sp. BGMRC 2118]